MAAKTHLCSLILCLFSLENGGADSIFGEGNCLFNVPYRHASGQRWE